MNPLKPCSNQGFQMPDYVQYIREYSLIVGKNGQGFEVAPPINIDFDINKTIVKKPNNMVIKIYNLTRDKQLQLLKEFTDVAFYAGYKFASGKQLIFTGNIKHAYQYSEGGTEQIVEFEVGDGDFQFLNAYINTTLSAQADNKLLLDQLNSAMGLPAGHQQVIGSSRKRGKVFSGSVRDYYTEIANNSGADWFIDNGQVVILPNSSTIPGSTIEIGVDSGLLSPPEITDKGIVVKSLLQPFAKVGGQIKIDNSKLKPNRSTEKPPSGQTLNKKSTLGKISTDGVYKIIEINHKGRYREGEWMTEILAVSPQTQVNATIQQPFEERGEDGD